MGKKRRTIRSRATGGDTNRWPSDYEKRRRETAQIAAKRDGLYVEGKMTPAIQEWETLLIELHAHLHQERQCSWRSCASKTAIWLAEHPEEAALLDVRDTQALVNRPDDWWRAAVKVWLNLHLTVGNSIEILDEDGNRLGAIVNVSQT